MNNLEIRWIISCLSFTLITISGIFPLFPDSASQALVPITSKNAFSETNHSISNSLPDFNIVAAGDWGCGIQAKRTLDYIVKAQPKVVLALGDLSYNRTANCWLDLVKPIISRVKIAVGYHDLNQGGKVLREEQYLNAFNLSKPYYSFNYQNVHFLALATEIAYNITDGKSLNADEYRFVKNDLNNASNDPSINWIIVFGYRPLYSSPSVHNASGILRDAYHPLFDRYGVDLVLQAHNHNYQRTYPLQYNPDRPSTPKIDNAGTTDSGTDQRGPIFITAGTAGQDLYNFTGKAKYVITQFLRNGFLNINVTKNGTAFETSFIDNINGQARDVFSIAENQISRKLY